MLMLSFNLISESAFMLRGSAFCVIEVMSRCRIVLPKLTDCIVTLAYLSPSRPLHASSFDDE